MIDVVRLVLMVWGAAVLVRFGFKVSARLIVWVYVLGVRISSQGREVPCPLCVGTERESLTYDVDDLAEHALAHPIEDVAKWAREVAPNQAWIEHLDDAYSDLIAVTTTTSEVDGQWSWLCTRCGANAIGFPSEESAVDDRLVNHRCEP
jgi:hypothetical protein